MRRLERAHGIRFDTLHLGGLPAAVDRPAPEFAHLARALRASLAHAPSRVRVLVEAG
jgi:ornithine decarboxylase